MSAVFDQLRSTGGLAALSESSKESVFSINPTRGTFTWSASQWRVIPAIPRLASE